MGKQAKAKGSTGTKKRKGLRGNRDDMALAQHKALRRRIEREIEHLLKFGPINSLREYENYHLSQVRNKEYVPSGSDKPTSEDR